MLDNSILVHLQSEINSKVNEESSYDIDFTYKFTLQAYLTMQEFKKLDEGGTRTFF